MNRTFVYEALVQSQWFSFCDREILNTVVERCRPGHRQEREIDLRCEDKKIIGKLRGDIGAIW